MSAFTSESVASPAGEEAGTLGRQARWLMAALALVAAGVHFAFAPDHFAEDWRHGTFFVVVAWLQLVWAILLIARPRRWVLEAGVIGNAGVIVIWAVSRTTGLPVGLGGGAAEPVAAPDLLCTVLEGLIVLGSTALLIWPSLADRRLRAPRLATGLTTGMAAIALVGASFSITPRFAGAHHHDEAAGGHGHETAGSETAGHDHGATGATAAKSAHSHDTGGPYRVGASPCEKALPNQDPEGSDKTKGHNHRGALPQEPVDAKTRQRLRAQQDQARAVVNRYPTVADALKDGYKLSTVYVPCIGAHYTNISRVAKFDPAAPSELLYDGTTPDAKIVGLSYLLWHPGGAPAGFAGPNDKWHQHSTNGGLCLNGQGVVIGGENTSKKDCEARGGHKNGLKDIWMVHDWVVPGWECSWGVFAGECPELGGRLGATAAS